MITARFVVRISVGLLGALLGLCPWLGAQQPTTPPLAPEVLEVVSAPAAAPTGLRIVSFNVHYAPDVAALADSIKETAALKDADIFLLQEIESYPSEGESRTRKLAEALELNYIYAPARYTDGGGTHGLAILSRYPLHDAKILPLPRFDLGARTRRRIALAATVDIAGRPLRLYNVHLDTRINTADRLEQLRPVLEAARQEKVGDVIIGGDFNTNPFRWLFNRLPIFRSDQAGAVDEFMQEHGFRTPLAELGSTMSKALFRARLDALYLRGLKASDAGVDRDVGVSDHFPVWVDLAWPTEVSRTGTQ